MFDTLITNATLLNLETGEISCNNSIAINGERITKIFSPSENDFLEARCVIDAEGRFVFPGFIDFHTHLFAHGSTFGLDADKLLQSGTTFAVDMGSAGFVNYPAMYECDIAPKKLRIKNFINISPVGQPGKGINEPLNDELLSVKDIRRIMNEYPGTITGLKVRISRGIVGSLGVTPLVRAVEMGDELGLPVCVHPTDPPVNSYDIAKILRPGDIYSHTYNGRGSTILNADNEIYEGILDARSRGVIFEVANGRINFNYPTAEHATRANFWPDIISSDATPATYHNGLVMWDLARVMSKFMNMGMSLHDVIRAVTTNPARRLDLDYMLGKVQEGYAADLVICRIDESIIEFADADGNSRIGKKGIVPEIVILKGQKSPLV